MITTIEAAELETRIRRRIEVGSQSFQSVEVLDASLSAMNGIYTNMRLSGQMHDSTTHELVAADLTQIAGRQFLSDYTLPETVGEVVMIEGVMGGGRYTWRIPKLAPQLAPHARGVAWQWLGGRPGRVRFYGEMGRFSSIVITAIRSWGPLHYGTAPSGGADTIQFDTTTQQGKVVRRDDVYIGMDVLITNDIPAGVQDQLGRIEAYDGATQTATVSVPWATAPSSGTTYGLAPPLSGEYIELLIEESAQILKEELSERLPPTNRLTLLREQFQNGLDRRDGEPNDRIFNQG